METFCEHCATDMQLYCRQCYLPIHDTQIDQAAQQAYCQGCDYRFTYTQADYFHPFLSTDQSKVPTPKQVTYAVTNDGFKFQESYGGWGVLVWLVSTGYLLYSPLHNLISSFVAHPVLSLAPLMPLVVYGSLFSLAVMAMFAKLSLQVADGVLHVKLVDLKRRTSFRLPVTEIRGALLLERYASNFGKPHFELQIVDKAGLRYELPLKIQSQKQLDFWTWFLKHETKLVPWLLHRPAAAKEKSDMEVNVAV